MKKLPFLLMMAALTLMPSSLFAQSTEGTDFWVTLMRGDERKYDELSLTFAAKEATTVFIENTYTNYFDTVSVAADTIARLVLNSHESSCYVTDVDEEKASNHALHVTSEKPISLIAANYKNKSFDVAAILPTGALKSEYRIQCYAPYAHADSPQGSHFAIVAVENDVIVDITPSVVTSTNRPAGQTFASDTLRKGQVYYVWTGKKSGDGADLSGTVVKARDNKKIAVFNGNSHTNIPTIQDRDHIYSQAMPVNYWGKRFAITSSLTTIAEASGYWERIDKIRVQALVDGTTVYIDGDSVYTFDFSKNPKHFYEFDFGAKDGKTGYTETSSMPYFEGASHYVETSCPSAVHLFMTSNRYDHAKVKGVNEKYCNGDPSLIWVNPIEQKIKTLTFGTFETQQVKDHFINIVTTKDNMASVKLDGNDISAQFQPLNGNPDYVFARITAVKNSAHTLVSDSGFIAHVYGFGERESYGYPAGGETKDLTAYITINGEEYHADSDNKICGGGDGVTFGCQLNYEYDSIYWNFGDQKDTMAVHMDSVRHTYEFADTYKAYVLIYRHNGEDDGCLNFSDHDSIAFHVTIGNYKVDINRTAMPYCSKEGDEVDFRIYLDNPAGVDLTGENVSITFDAAATKDGFKNSDLSVVGDTMLVVHIPSSAKSRTPYALDLHIGSECPENELNKQLEFVLTFDIPVLEQHYNNVLGLLKDSFPNQELSNFVWIHDGDTLPDQKTSVLYLDETDPKNSGEYHVCFNVHENGKTDYVYCTCPIKFTAKSDSHEFRTDSLSISASYTIAGDNIFVNANYNGQANIDCYAQWITASGTIYQGLKFNIPDGGCTIPAPAENGLYLLRVVTGKETRSFKFLIKK